MAINISLDDTLSQIKVQAQEGLQQILKENQERKLQEKQEPIVKAINPDCIKLNVGGKKFMTTKAILMNMPDSKLAKIITGRYPLMFDHKKRIFIDRNGEYFGYVLDCLREGKVDLPLDGPLRKRIKAELEFFDFIEKPVLKKLVPDAFKKKPLPNGRTSFFSYFRGWISKIREGGVVCRRRAQKNSGKPYKV